MTIELSPIDEVIKAEFGLDSVHGRDSIAAQIKKDIDEYSQKLLTEGPRSHLGASVIGHNCERYIWFHFRWMKIEQASGRMLRLFNRGTLEEARLIQWLTGIGFNITAVDDKGKQIRLIDVGGHFGGSSDGSSTVPTRYGTFTDKFLLEFKTANEKSFTITAGSGVRKGKPRHWTQMCVYGYKFQLQYALYLIVNKNTDEIEPELLELDWGLAEAEIAKAEKIITATMPPPRISDNASYWECKSCPMNGICHLNQEPDRNCRSCQFAQPVEDGKWKCHFYNNIIPVEFLAKGCDQWRSLPH